MTVEQQHLDVVAAHREGVLATIKRDGRPQLSNVLYLWDAERQMVRISTTGDRAKARNLQRDPRASLYVGGTHFWTYVVIEGDAELSPVSVTPGDAAGQELLEIHSAFFGAQEPDEFFAQMVDNRRLVIRLRAARTYGLVMNEPPRA